MGRTNLVTQESGISQSIKQITTRQETLYGKLGDTSRDCSPV